MTLPNWVHYDLATRRVAPGKGPLVAVKRGKELFEGNDYPRDWDGFIGQAQAKEQLMVAVASAKARGVRLEHTLLASGQHGVGKSTLATLLAHKSGAGIVQTTGPLDIDKAQRLLAHMKDNDILFIDEAHTLVSKRKADAEWLLPFMVEGKLYTENGALDCPDVAIVAATTDAGRLPRTILSRFMVKPKIVAYTETEAGLIAANLSKRMKVKVPSADLPAIAQAANGNPRDMRSILTAIRDLQLTYPGKPVDLDKAFDWAGFSRDGLSVLSREILMVLCTQTNYTASIESLQAILGEPGPLRHDEQDLMQRGYVSITGRGRQLTEAGMLRAEELRKEAAA